MTKEEYFDYLEDIITDTIYLTESTEELHKEIGQNMWQISIASETAQAITVSEFSQFINQVIQNRKEQLNAWAGNTKLLFYIWLDEQAAQLRFNFINSKHGRPPFGAKLERVESQDEIIHNFLNYQYLDGIPIDSLRFITEEDDDDIEEEYVLKIYTEEL